MTPLIIAFISGIAVGVIIMAFSSATTLDHSERKEDQLKEIVHDQEQEIRMYDEFIQSLKHSDILEKSNKTQEQHHLNKN
ncbi:MAG: hypothetical protein GF372_13000 [Candidatus Marinimicrobia bacterium]|nr:hypothetical protein [Candidatus Neomarinimicrobiota bacterium]